MPSLLSHNTCSISRREHGDVNRIPEAAGTAHPRLQALLCGGQRRQPCPWQLASERENCPLPSDGENPRLTAQFSLLS